MGEYARYKGESVKIGTCENMYYLRADQRHLVGYDWDQQTLEVVRFRFPFPDEDTIEPGHFEDYDRGWRIPGYSLPEELSGDEHRAIQFTSPVGYNLCIPCPEGVGGKRGLGPVDVGGIKVHRNGFNGGPVVRQQAFRFGRLVTLVSCGACGALHRLDTIEKAEPVIEAFLSEADRTEWRRSTADWDHERNGWRDGPTTYADEPVHTGRYREELLTIAARILAGYSVTTPGEKVPA